LWSELLNRMEIYLFQLNFLYLKESPVCVAEKKGTAMDTSFFRMFSTKMNMIPLTTLSEFCAIFASILFIV